MFVKFYNRKQKSGEDLLRADCRECARLWESYLNARREYSEAWRAMNGSAPSGSAEDQAAARRAKAAYGAREQVRMELAEHEETHK
jgi:hypothetical protein